MADIAKEIADVDARRAAINEELRITQQEVDTIDRQIAELNAQKDKIVLSRKSLRIEREGLSQLRDSKQAQQAKAIEQEATAKAKADAEASLAKQVALQQTLEAQSKELAELIENAKAQQATPAK